ncbi:MAG: serine/threonine-protein kinase, partial [Planctomycetota bacterium]
PSDLASDPGFRERFRREAAVLQTLRHDGIVMVHHAAEDGERFFLTMDYVDGGSLDDRLKAEGKLAEEETACIALELCQALSYAHGKGIVHRDIKPANVLLDSDGRAKVSDFGLARVVGDDFLKSMTERSISLSMARTDGGALSQSDNAVVGTYEYMSPEQKAGEPADERSDIYSLGLVIYRMLTGEKAEGLFDMPSEVGCSQTWDAVVRKALAAKPERRYVSLGELASELEGAVEESRAGEARGTEVRRAEAERARREREAAEGRRREEVMRTVPAPRRSRKGLVAVVGLVLVLLTAWFFYRQPSLELTSGTITKTRRFVPSDGAEPWFNQGKVGFRLRSRSALEEYGKLGYVVVEETASGDTTTQIAGQLDTYAGKHRTHWVITADKPGTYRMDVNDEEGDVIASARFRIRRQ